MRELKYFIVSGIGMVVALGIFFNSLALGADSRLYSHRFASYPNDRDDCDLTGKEVLEQFAQITGAKVGHTILQESDEGRTCSIAFDYTSAQPMKAESTFKGDFFSSLDSSGGMYATSAECEADLPAQKALFERATGLRAVVSYCYHVDNIETAGSDREYVLRIDGFGKAVQHLFDFDEILDGGSPPADLESRVWQGLSDQGVNVARVTLKRGLGGIIPELIVFYYAPERLPIGFWAITPTTDEQCRSMLTVAPEWFEAAGEPSLFAYCKPSLEGAAYPQLLVFRIAQAKSGIVDAPKMYRTYERCVAAQSEVFAEYQEKEKWQPFGAFCGLTWDGYQMTVFGPRRK